MSERRDADLDAIKTDLNRVLLEALRESPDTATQARIKHRYEFGRNLLILAVFCVVLAAVPWPTKGMFVTATWLLFGLTLLFVGAWQIRRASKEALKAQILQEDLASSVHPKPKTTRRLRPVK